MPIYILAHNQYSPGSIQVVALLAEVTKKVQEHEPGTLIYYAFQPQGKKEIVVVERLVQQERKKSEI